MGLLRIDTFERDGLVVVRPRGDVDLATAPEFDTALVEALDRASRSRRAMVVVDLTDVAFFGSAGLPPLLCCHGAGAERGIDVAVVHNPMVRRVLAITGVDAELVLYESLSDIPAARPDGHE